MMNLLLIGGRLFIVLPLLLIFNNRNNNALVVVAQDTSTSTSTSTTTLSTYQSSLPQINENIDYAEDRLSFVHFPPEAKPLLEREMSHIHSPLVLDVVTTVTHWHAPLWQLMKGLIHRFRNQNQIIYVRAHYYVSNGLTEEGCRIEWVDTDTGVSKDIAVNSDTCARRCTNGGRYCAPKFHDNEFPFEPKLLVEETLRRLCIDDLYHASDLKHWEYLEAFEKFQCFQAGNDMTNCSKRALGEVAHTDWSSVIDCVQLAGGLDQDVMNVRLQEQLDRQQGSYNLRQVPMIHIGGTPYEGDWTVSGLLTSVCSAYQRVYDITPVACDFCSPCTDVRKCLWYLECDGNPFSTDTYHPGAFQQQFQQPNTTTTATATAAPQVTESSPPAKDGGLPPPPPPPPPPQQQSTATTNTQANSEDDTAPQPLAEEEAEEGTAITTAATTSTTTMEEQQQEQDSSTTNQNNNNNNNNNNNGGAAAAAAADNNKKNNDDDEDVNTSGFFIGGILAGLIFGLIPAYCFSRDEKRTRRAISAALASRDPHGGLHGGLGNSQGSYHDDDLLQMSLSTGVTVARPTREELQNMEDVTIDDSDPYSATAFGSNFEAAAIEIVQPPYKDNPSSSSSSSPPASVSSGRNHTGDSVRRKGGNNKKPMLGFKSKLKQEFV